MKLLSDMPLKSKLVLPIIMFAAMIFFTSQGYAFFSAHEAQKENLINRVSVLAKGVAYNLQAAILFDDRLSAAEVLDAFSADNDIVSVKLYSSDNQLFAEYLQQGNAVPTPTESQRKDIDKQQFAVGEDFIFLLIPVTVEQESIAEMNITISKDSFQQLYNTALTNGMIFLFLLTVASSVLYFAVDKFIVRPLHTLNLGMRNYINSQQKGVSIESSANDEIGDLVRAFNTMLQRLNQRDQQVAYTLDKLEAEKSFANEVVETVKHALIVVEPSGEVRLYNAAACRVFKCSSVICQGANLVDLMSDDNRRFIKNALENDLEFTDEQVWTRDVFDQPQLLQITCTKLTKREQFLFAIQDITEVEAALSRQRLAAGVFENSQDGLMVTNESDVITMVNPALTELLGYPQESLLGKMPEQVFDWQQFRSLMPAIKDAVIQFGQWQGEVWEKDCNGKKVPMFAKVSRIKTAQSDSKYDYVYILSDLSSIKEMERLEYLAHHDSLTGVANRAQLYRVLDETLKQEHDETSGWALLYLDLDGFKQVNDSFGHDAGDEVLKQVAQRLVAQVGTHDLIARLSGDEFVVFVRSIDKEALTPLSERIMEVVREDIVYRNQILNVGVSVGVTYVDEPEQSMESIIKRADLAMYQAKNNGKSRIVIER